MATPTEILARPLATVRETTQVVPVSLGQVYAMTKTGELESVKVGRRVLIKTDSIRRLLDGGDVPKTA